jgi:hypothetical protein
MATKKKLLQAAAGSAGGEALNVEDVFSTYLYDGTASARDITNGINLADEGGLIWTKQRGIGSNNLNDTERGVGKYLTSNNTAAEGSDSLQVTAYNTDGYSLGGDSAQGTVNYTYSTGYASWTFRKAPKFFDVVTWTGDGTAGRTVSHNLGSAPGMMIIKRTDTGAAWYVYHREMLNTDTLRLNTTAAKSTNQTNFLNSTDPTDTEFTLGSEADVNGSGGTFIAYLFAHNDGDGEFGPDGDADIIKCGSYTGNYNSGSEPVINLGFEPQWILFKNATTASNWVIYDTMRGWINSVNTKDYSLAPDSSAAENGVTGNADAGTPTATGFDLEACGLTAVNSLNDTHIYIAIRRGPMAVPESATEVFDVRAGFTGTDRPQFPSGFVTDMGLLLRTSGANPRTSARLIQGQMLKTNLTDAETANSAYVFDYQNGWLDSGLDTSYYGYSWKRAPNYFDVVCYTGTGSAQTINHNLGVVPEMMWVKPRNGAEGWAVYHSALGATKYLKLDTTDAETTLSTIWNDTAPTDSVFTVGTAGITNDASYNLIAYLFASLDGVSKVGSFTHTFLTDTAVDCGFSSGARFVLIKRTDSSGDWRLYDSVRGITAGADPELKLNTTDAEYTSGDYLVPNSSGFTVEGDNYNSGTYIFYAIA